MTSVHPASKDADQNKYVSGMLYRFPKSKFSKRSFLSHLNNYYYYY